MCKIGTKMKLIGDTLPSIVMHLNKQKFKNLLQCYQEKVTIWIKSLLFSQF